MEISVNLEDLFELISPENQPSPPASSIEESRLIALAVANDEEAFEGLIAMHQDSIFRFCIRWLRDVEDAREATQDTFVKAYFAIGRYRQKGKFSTWLYQIALNQCRDRLKSKDKPEPRANRLAVRIGASGITLLPSIAAGSIGRERQ